MPVGTIAQLVELLSDVLSVVFKNGVEDSPHVLNHYGCWAGLADDPESGWEEVPLIVFAELLPGHRERRAGKAAAHDIDSSVRCSIEFTDVLLKYIPTRAVQSEGIAGMPVELDQGYMVNIRLLKAYGLPSGSCAEFQGR
jgi:hypothetical protein